MYNSISSLVGRSSAALGRRQLGSSGTVMDLLIAFLGIAFFGLVLTALLIVLRRWKQQRRMREEILPQYNDIKHDEYHNKRRLTIQTPHGRSSIVVVDNRPMLADPNSPPHSPNNVPEIHITFPDEHDEFGRKQTGRVMLVRVGDTTVGLEPVHDEQLPAYEKENKNGFYSIDMDQIGGLKEKDHSQFQ
ncbi:hypothetical protein BX600DRAFT_224229 [Xylariales sp. PMI_506]|nr:hypothetical protein BX600DRAFT_224229 [Xylariales sp. PMI_506]